MDTVSHFLIFEKSFRGKKREKLVERAGLIVLTASGVS